MSENIILDGLVLMVVGMSVVFAFLGLLVGAMNLCAAFFIRFAHWFPEAPWRLPPLRPESVKQFKQRRPAV
jgi:Na+-transporting methylmalonyl-CoA/oxaloacetate decarboxylase gamma subunit